MSGDLSNQWNPGTRYPELFTALASPFEPHEVDEVQVGGGNVAKYVDARTVMDRLDKVMGPENWEDNYFPCSNGMGCTLTLHLPDGSTVVKSDGAGSRGMRNKDGTPDVGDDIKGTFSDAFKRAAVKFGIGRYLYNIPVQRPSNGNGNGNGYQSQPQNGYGNGHGQPANGYGHQQQVPQQQSQPPAGGWGVPTRGPQLFSWCKKQEETNGLGLIEHLQAWAKTRGEQNWRIADWSDQMVKEAYAEACRKLGIGQSQPVSNPVSPPSQPDNGELHGLRQAVWAQCRQLAKHALGVANDHNYSPPEEQITAQVNQILQRLGFAPAASVNQLFVVETLRQVSSKAQEQLNIVASFPTQSAPAVSSSSIPF